MAVKDSEIAEPKTREGPSERQTDAVLRQDLESLSCAIDADEIASTLRRWLSEGDAFSLLIDTLRNNKKLRKASLLIVAENLLGAAMKKSITKEEIFAKLERRSRTEVIQRGRAKIIGATRL